MKQDPHATTKTKQTNNSLTILTNKSNKATKSNSKVTELAEVFRSPVAYFEVRRSGPYSKVQQSVKWSSGSG